jgi:hypothetical protein
VRSLLLSFVRTLLSYCLGRIRFATDGVLVFVGAMVVLLSGWLCARCARAVDDGACVGCGEQRQGRSKRPAVREVRTCPRVTSSATITGRTRFELVTMSKVNDTGFLVCAIVALITFDGSITSSRPSRSARSMAFMCLLPRRL